MAFCTKCGAKVADTAAFCTKCGTKVVRVAPRQPAATPQAQAQPPAQAPQQAEAPSLVSQAGAAATSVSAAYGTATRAAGMAASAAGVVSLPWQTIVTGQSVDVQGMLRAAAPSLLAMAPRPNLRKPALAIAFTVVMDVGIALVSGGAVNVPMLLMRVVTGAGTAVLGAITGGKGGGLRKVTGLVSVVFGVVQLVSLLVAAYQAIATPTTLLALLPSIVAVVSGLVLSVSTAIAGFRR